jgi:hypothetical protein
VETLENILAKVGRSGNLYLPYFPLSFPPPIQKGALLTPLHIQTQGHFLAYGKLPFPDSIACKPREESGAHTMQLLHRREEVAPRPLHAVLVFEKTWVSTHVVFPVQAPGSPSFSRAGSLTFLLILGTLQRQAQSVFHRRISTTTTLCLNSYDLTAERKLSS